MTTITTDERTTIHKPKPVSKTRNKPIITVIGANLWRERQKRGLSQDALARLAGLHRTYVGSVERAERNVSAQNIERLARALGIEEADLMHRDPVVRT